MKYRQDKDGWYWMNPDEAHGRVWHGPYKTLKAAEAAARGE